jgi:hypothetical protein
MFPVCAVMHSQRVRQYLTNLGLGFSWRFARQRRKRPASLEKSGLVTPPIRQTLASRTFDGTLCAFQIKFVGTRSTCPMSL